MNGESLGGSLGPAPEGDATVGSLEMRLDAPIGSVPPKDMDGAEAVTLRPPPDGQILL